MHKTQNLKIESTDDQVLEFKFRGKLGYQIIENKQVFLSHGLEGEVVIEKDQSKMGN